MKKLLIVIALLVSATLPFTSTVQAAVAPFHFVFTADSRDDYTVLPVLSHKMVTLNPAFGFFAGDLCGSFDVNCINNTWKPALDGNNNDGMLAKTFVSRGNHDNGSITTWQGLWNFQTMAATVGATNYTAQVSNATYSFDYSNSHFSIIDLPGGGSSSWTSAEITWLDADLTAAEGRGVSHEFIFAHGPMYGVTAEHGSEQPSAALKAVLNKHPISAGFHGHEHVTAYTDVTPSREAGINNYPQFTMGRAGAPPYNVVKPVDWSASQNAFADVYVNGNDFTVTIYGQSGAALFTKTFTNNGATPVPPTATTNPPTATLIPPTSTPIPPTATTLPPTKTQTPIPPTFTKTPLSTSTVIFTSTPTATTAVTSIPPTATNIPATQTQTSVPPTFTNTPLPANTATTTNTPAATIAPTITPTPGGSLSSPLRLAFYYPWFPEAWNQLNITPYTNYHPSLGYYNSSDQTILKQQIAAMQYGGIQAGIASWWGQGSQTDSRVNSLLQASTGTSFRWALYFEPESLGDPSVAQITSDLTYIRDHYAGNPGFLKIGGRFVVFVYANGTDSCGMADRWKQANTVNAYIVLKVFANYRTCASQPDGWHQYSPAVATDYQSGSSYAISPGFWKMGENRRLVRDLTSWNTSIRNMVASGAPFQLITTFNEWGEGTSIESATEWSSPSGYGAYLDALHNNGQSGSIPTSASGPTATWVSTSTPNPLPTLTSTPTNIPTATPTQTQVVVASPTSTSAATMKFLPSADTFTDASNPAVNNGGLIQLRIDNSPVVNSYLRFNIQGLGGSVTKATLRVYANSSSSAGYQVYKVPDTSWGETALTYTNAPAFGSLAGSMGSFSGGTWTTVDVTTSVTGNGIISFALTGNNSTAISFGSRESGANAPQLEITMGDVGASPTLPPPAATPTLISTIVPTDTPTLTATSTSIPTATATQTQVVVASPTSTLAATAKFLPSADTFTDASNPTVNNGGLIQLRIDNSPVVNSYLRFNIQGLSGSVTKATLRVYANSSSSAGYQVYKVPDTSWGETALTYSNAPAFGSLTGSMGSFSGGTWTMVDVTTSVAGNGIISFALTGNNSTAISFGSRESGPNAPQLVITVGGNSPSKLTSPSPSPTATKVISPPSTPTQAVTVTPVVTDTPVIPSSTPSPTELPTSTATAVPT